MKYVIVLATAGILCFAFALTSCAPRSSRQLLVKAVAACEDVPELDQQRLICAIAYLTKECEMDRLDLRVCGRIAK